MCGLIKKVQLIPVVDVTVLLELVVSFETLDCLTTGTTIAR